MPIRITRGACPTGGPWTKPASFTFGSLPGRRAVCHDAVQPSPSVPRSLVHEGWPTPRAGRGFGLGLLTLAALLAAPAARTEEPELRPEDLPHFPAVEPARALDTFVVRPGFRLELAAHEPEVMDPIALSFDERGRIYVVEMRDYSERRPERLGRVRRLEDRDGDGRFETSSVYVDGLPWPTAVTCWNGGIFVGSTPDLIYAKDTDGDGRADLRETVFTGFASDFAPYATNKLNVQAMMNSLQWGLDNRIHGCGSMSGGTVTLVDSEFTRKWRAAARPEGAPPPTPPPLSLRGRDFSFDPHRLDLRAETGGGQYGMHFDDQGRKYLCSNSDHLQIALYEDRYAGRDSAHPLPASRASIAVDGPAAEVFRLSPEEPWRVLRTRWRVTGLVQGLIEGGGRSSGYFTSATGLTVYRGDAYGPEYAGDVFVADCGSNLIHRKKISTHGLERRGTRPGDERDREFIACRDTWFRPVQFANAPDGCLWIIDMYREIIEHPWSLPPGIKRLLDLNAGNDRGRLYRIVPEGRTPRRSVSLAEATTPELVATLRHPNAWHRETASRLLVERRDPGAFDPLRATLDSTAPPLARLHALLTLEALGACTDAQLLAGLDDSDPDVRRHAIRLVEFHHASGPLPPALTSALGRRAADTPEVLLQLAFTLGTVPHPDKAALLARILNVTHRADGGGLVADAALQAAGDDAARVFARLASASEAGGAAHDQHLPALAGILGRRQKPDELAATVNLLAQQADRPHALALLARFADGLRRAGGTLAKADPEGKLDALKNRARETVARRDGAPDDRRIEAIRLVGHLPASEARPALLPLLVAGESPAVQRAALEELLRTDDRPAVEALFGAWAGVNSDARGLALELVLRRGAGPGQVLDAVEARTLAPQDLSMAQLTALRAHRDGAIRARATRLLGAPAESRDAAVASLLPALNLRGDPARGRAIHENLCAPCHRLEGKGFALGPDFESVRSQPKEKLLVAIVDPNREVQPAYLATQVETRDDEEIAGLLASETASGIVLRQAGGVEVSIARDRIRAVVASGRSIMPEGFETSITAQQFADLLALLTGKP